MDRVTHYECGGLGFESLMARQNESTYEVGAFIFVCIESRDSKPKGSERPGNHEFPDHEKNDLDLDFLLFVSCSFIHEFPFFKIKQQAGNCFTRYLQRREKQFPDE